MNTGEKLGLGFLVLLGAAGLALTGTKKVNVLPNPQIPPDVEGVRRSLLETALSEVGHVGGDKYWADVNPKLVGSGLDWCGGFVLWDLHQNGLALDRQWIMGSGFILTPPFPLHQTMTPQPGDIIYIDQPNQHQGLFLGFSGDLVHTVDGNTKNVVTTHERPNHGITFFSIDSLINQAGNV